MNENSREFRYKYDDNNKNSIMQIIYYLTLSKKYNGSLNKGFILSGSIGTGKTMIMTIITEIMKYARFNIPIVHSCDIVDSYLREDFERIEKYKSGIMIIDDLGVEETSINRYGSVIMPIVDILNNRYSANKLTFITTNLGASDIQKKYGERVRDRLREMCGLINMSGDSRRR